MYQNTMKPGLLFTEDAFGNRSYFQEIIDQNGQIQYVPCLSPQDQECFARQMMQQQMDLYVMNTRKEIEYEYLQKELSAKEAYHARLEQQKLHAKNCQAEAYEKLRTERELSQVSVFMDDSGRLCRMIELPGREKQESKPIMDQKNMKLLIIRPINSHEMLEILDWEGCKNRIVLPENGGPKAFWKALGKAGIVFKARNERKRELSDMVYAFLKQHAEVYDLWPAYGWNQDKSGHWHFCDEDEMTFDDYRRTISE